MARRPRSAAAARCLGKLNDKRRPGTTGGQRFCSGAPPWAEREVEKHIDGQDEPKTVHNEGHDRLCCPRV